MNLNNQRRNYILNLKELIMLVASEMIVDEINFVLDLDYLKNCVIFENLIYASYKF